MSAFVIDAFELCRSNGRLEGEFKLSELPRLAQESVDASGQVRWSLIGEVDKLGHSRLALNVSGSVRLMCQRCLTPFDFQIGSAAELALAEDEAGADELEEFLSNEPVEVIVGSKAFNVQDLIEDEALLAIPASPKHDSCVAQPLRENGDEMAKVSPFEVLKKLKQ